MGQRWVPGCQLSISVLVKCFRSLQWPATNDSGYPHDGRADKNPYPHDCCADKDSYPQDSNNQCILLRLELSFMMINVQMMLV